MAIQHLTYKSRLRAHSGLSPLALLVALTIADLRYEDKKLSADDPLSLSMPELAAACGMKSKNTARRWLEECIASGWIIAAATFRDGRQQPNGYWIVDPRDSAEVNRLTSVIQSRGPSGVQILRSSGGPKPVKRLDTVVRSNNRDADDDAAPRGGGVSDEKSEQNPPPPDLTNARPLVDAVGASPDAHDASPEQRQGWSAFQAELARIRHSRRERDASSSVVVRPTRAELEAAVLAAEGSARDDEYLSTQTASAAASERESTA